MLSMSEEMYMAELEAELEACREEIEDLKEELKDLYRELEVVRMRADLWERPRCEF